MTWLEWLLLYLLCGFMISWSGTYVRSPETLPQMKWDFIATVFWPIGVAVGFFRTRKRG